MQQPDQDVMRLGLVARLMRVVGIATVLAGIGFLVYMAVAGHQSEGTGSLWAVGAILVVVGAVDIGISEWMRRRLAGGG